MWTMPNTKPMSWHYFFKLYSYIIESDLSWEYIIALPFPFTIEIHFMIATKYLWLERDDAACFYPCPASLCLLPVDYFCFFLAVPWRRKWQPTPVLLPGEFHGLRSLVGYSPWSHKELDTTERFSVQALVPLDPKKTKYSGPFICNFYFTSLLAWTRISAKSRD